MLFNSYEFIFLFLPAAVIGFLLLGMTSRNLALGWLILVSICFYTWWRPFNLLIIGPSLLVNYVFARILAQLATNESYSRAKVVVLTLGIIFNLALLGYFKYANFFVSVVNDVAATDFMLERIILPLGLSFITFQKIAFLIDVAGGRVERFTAWEFLLFVLFFPQLIAGPIVHFRELIPQFRGATCKFESQLYAVALTLFCFGLFKKVVLADGIAQHVSPIFDFAAAGGTVTMVQAWLAGIGFSLQIYFDFSAYSDMASAIALFFGVRLPLNFDSPLKATSIIDFWMRWHITLTRFLTSYVYNPISLAIVRRRAAKGRPLLVGGNRSVGAFISIVVLPTLFTMFLSGVWHGAGYTFLVWGLIHGFYLVANQAWRLYGARTHSGAAPRRNLSKLAGFAATFLAVAFAIVFFRAADLPSALNIAKGMLGLQGVSLPDEIAAFIGTPWLPPMVLLEGEVWTRQLILEIAFTISLLFIAVLMPNSLQLLSHFKPVLNSPSRPPTFAAWSSVHWRPTAAWLAIASVISFFAVTRTIGESEFLYWQF